MNVRLESATFVGGPSYMFSGDAEYNAMCEASDPYYSGEEFLEGPMAVYDYFIQTYVAGKTYTLNHVFRWWEGEEAAEEMVAKIYAKGYIDLAHWSEGTCWDAYKTPQTWEEEKAEALEKEAWGLGGELARVW